MGSSTARSAGGETMNKHRALGDLGWAKEIPVSTPFSRLLAKAIYYVFMLGAVVAIAYLFIKEW